MGKKKFIDKKKAVTFRLVNRSQRDPLIVDETAPQHVLVPIRPFPNKQPSCGSETGPKLDPIKRKQEQTKYGIYFDDDYDYLQHLKEPGQNTVHWEPIEPRSSGSKSSDKSVEKKPTIQLPSSVFESKFEEKEGLLGKTVIVKGPRPDWDPDVVAALDDDFDHQNPDNELEDNFMELACAEGDNDFDEDDEYEDYDGDEDEENYSDVPFNNDSDNEECDRLGPLMKEYDFDKEETKSRFTEYSMSSSVIRRNQQLTLLDDRFEKFYENYDEPEIGALDCEEIEGHVEISDDVLLKYAEEFESELNCGRRKLDTVGANKEKILQYASNIDTDEEELVEMEVVDKKEKWDCESILSTYSNIYNHPKLIEEPRKSNKILINDKTGMPKNILNGDNGKLTAKSLTKLQNEATGQVAGPKSLCDGSVISTLSVLSIRPKDESKDEKRERKRLLKEYRAERRIERKANTQAFKQEKFTQETSKINTLPGTKIL
uniref:Protein LTV1 homolog n=1 Tax=Corethrella appendiculata TaxID=1370023 RepID=U5EY17_9DIPT